MSHHHRRAAAVSAPDPYFSNTVLLLTGNGTNGGQNNTFLDDSSNNFTITRNGNTTQGSFSPFGWQWSNYFDGTGDYLSAPGGTAFDLGSGNFTIEGWLQTTVTQPAYAGLVQRSNTGTSRYVVGFGSSGKTLESYMDSYSISSPIAGSATTVTDGSWHHWALVRNGNTFKLYVDGVAGATSVTSSATIATSTNNFNIGYDANSATRYFNGYLSSVRLTKSAVYTADFTPPTAPLTAITNTQLLTCQSNRFIDNSSNAFAITRNGDVAVSNFAPFPAGEYASSVEGGSGYFDGTGDYLTAGGQTAYQFGTEDFTIEFWIYFTSVSGQSNIMDFRGSAGTPAIAPVIYRLSGVIRFFTNGSDRIVGTTSVTTGQWYHIAVARSGTSTKLFLNGIQEGSTYTDSNSYGIGTNAPSIGSSFTTTYTTGYISSLRLIKGTAQYTSNFTPPTAPLTAITNTQLLLNFTNGSIVDATGKNNLETVGNAQVSTSVKKYGTGSLAFDGTGDWLTVRDTADLRLGTGNFTIEFWLYLAATGSARGCVGKGTATTGWLVSTDSSNKVVFTYGSSTITSTGVLSGSTWYHIAVVREGTGTNQTKIYIDGTNDGTGTVSTDFTQTNLMYIGADRTGGSAMNGNIDDLRITKTARYTANFTPPYRQLPTR